MASALDSLVKQIRIDTEYGPPIIIDRPFSPDAAAGPSPLKWLKPKITITSNLDAVNPIVSAPWGEPGPTRWPGTDRAGDRRRGRSGPAGLRYIPRSALIEIPHFLLCPGVSSFPGQ